MRGGHSSYRLPRAAYVSDASDADGTSQKHADSALFAAFAVNPAWAYSRFQGRGVAPRMPHTQRRPRIRGPLCACSSRWYSAYDTDSSRYTRATDGCAPARTIALAFAPAAGVAQAGCVKQVDDRSEPHPRRVRERRACSAPSRTERFVLHVAGVPTGVFYRVTFSLAYPCSYTAPGTPPTPPATTAPIRADSPLYAQGVRRRQATLAKCDFARVVGVGFGRVAGGDSVRVHTRAVRWGFGVARRARLVQAVCSARRAGIWRARRTRERRSRARASGMFARGRGRHGEPERARVGERTRARARRGNGPGSTQVEKDDDEEGFAMGGCGTEGASSASIFFSCIRCIADVDAR
ncbi:hypothetical protein FB451DRAFT_1258291, partial [Mycena latifolia]